MAEIIRGERRRELRKEERRTAVRTPGKMKKIMDAVYKTERARKQK